MGAQSSCHCGATMMWTLLTEAGGRGGEGKGVERECVRKGGEERTRLCMRLFKSSFQFLRPAVMLVSVTRATGQGWGTSPQ